MRFYKDIIDDIENAGKSAKYHCHEWSVQSIKFFWDICTESPTIRRQFYPIEYWEDFLTWASAHIKNNPSNVADVGCGNGNLIDVVRGVYPKASICGVDLSEESLKQVKDRFRSTASISFKVGSLEKLPFADNSLDLITCTEVLEHTFLETFANSFSEIQRVLKGGGYYLASVPFEERASFVNCPECGSIFTPYQHMIFEIAHRDISNLLSENNLELVKYYQSIDRSEPRNALKKFAKSLLINWAPKISSRFFPRAGVSGFLAKKCLK